MPHEPIKVGSADKIKGRLRDLVGDALVPVDLTGATVTLKVRINKGTVKSFPAVADPDQVGNRGVFTYQLSSSPADIDKPGDVEIEVHATITGVIHKSKSVFLTAEKAVA